MKDWEANAALLWKHDSAKFMKLTPRMREQPVVEVFGSPTNNGDITILLASVAALAGIVVAAICGVLA